MKDSASVEPDDMQAFLSRNNLLHLETLFVDNRLTEVDLLFDLTEEDLRELRILIGDRKRLGRALRKEFEKSENVLQLRGRRLSLLESLDKLKPNRSDSKGSNASTISGSNRYHRKIALNGSSTLEYSSSSNVVTSSSAEETDLKTSQKVKRGSDTTMIPGLETLHTSTTIGKTSVGIDVNATPKSNSTTDEKQIDLQKEKTSQHLSETAALRRKNTAQKVGSFTALLEGFLIAMKATTWWAQLIVYLPGFAASFYAVQWRERIDVWAAARGLKIVDTKKSDLDSENETVEQSNLDHKNDASGEDAIYFSSPYQETVTGYLDDESDIDSTEDPALGTSTTTTTTKSTTDDRTKLRIAAFSVVLKTFWLANVEFLLILVAGSVVSAARDHPKGLSGIGTDTVLEQLGIIGSSNESSSLSGAFRALVIIFLSLSLLIGLTFVYTVRSEFKKGIIQKAHMNKIGNIRLRKLRVLSTDPEIDTRIPDSSDLENRPFACQFLDVKIEDFYDSKNPKVVSCLRDELGPTGAIVKLIKFGL